MATIPKAPAASPKIEAELARSRTYRCGTPSKRACLTCGRVFTSQGRHNRMCTPCRKHGADVSPYAA